MVAIMSKDFNARGSGHTAAVRMLVIVLLVFVLAAAAAWYLA